MNILVVYNERREWGGEDVVVAATEDVLRDAGCSVVQWRKTNSDIGTSLLSKSAAGVRGVHSLRARREATRIANELRPDIVHAHNIYPSFSPSIFAPFRERGARVVLHVHSFFLTCPIASHFRDGAICHACLGPGREANAIRHNCRGKLPESIAYAARCASARLTDAVVDGVDAIVVPSSFVKSHLVDAGYPARLIQVVHNPVAIPDFAAMPSEGSSAVFVGRIAAGKGADILVDAAALAQIPVTIAGDGPDRQKLERRASGNTSFVGFVNAEARSALYQSARFAVVPSTAYETFCLSLAEAMAFGVPVVAARRSALAELVEDGVSGLLVEPDEPAVLANAMRALWEDPTRCAVLGANARERARALFHRDRFREALLELYGRLLSSP